MKLFLSATLLMLASCNTLPSMASNHKTLRLDVQKSRMTHDVLDDEEPMTSARLSLQYQNGEGSDQQNHLTGAVSQLGVSLGKSSQNIDIQNVGSFDFEVEQAQIDLGVRFYDNWNSRYFQPFMGVGVAPTWTEFNDGANKDGALSVGGYAEIGVETAIGNHGRAGLSYRYMGGLGGEINDESIDLDAGALMFSLGWSF